MSVHKAGFAERVFEFAFNSEYCVKNSAVLAACPYIPTQQQEKRLGYDVKMTVNRRGGGTSSLFLQHKVSRFVDSRTGSNAHFYNAVEGSYFAFSLDIPQYNLIHHAATSKRETFFYCAPAFTTRREMDERFLAQSVTNDSVFFDIAGAGRIADTTSHCIVYNSDGSKAWRFSEEPIKISGIRASLAREFARKILVFDRDTVAETYESLLLSLKEWWPDRQKIRRKTDSSESRTMPEVLPPHRDINRLDVGIEAVRELTVEYYGVSWLIGVQQ